MQVTCGDCVIDSKARELRRRGEPIPLSPKAFELLLILLECGPTAVSKRTLQDRLWPNMFVVEKNLTNLIAEIRKAIGDKPSAPRFIRTVQRFGYAWQDASPPDDRGTVRPANETYAVCVSWSEGRATLGEASTSWDEAWTVRPTGLTNDST
jgi:DNA-binding winged helix-turn-helix (wHTH) protein